MILWPKDYGSLKARPACRKPFKSVWLKWFGSKSFECSEFFWLQTLNVVQWTWFTLWTLRSWISLKTGKLLKSFLAFWCLSRERHCCRQASIPRLSSPSPYPILDSAFHLQIAIRTLFFIIQFLSTYLPIFPVLTVALTDGHGASWRFLNCVLLKFPDKF